MAIDGRQMIVAKEAKTCQSESKIQNSNNKKKHKYVNFCQNIKTNGHFFL